MSSEVTAREKWNGYHNGSYGGSGLDLKSIMYFNGAHFDGKTVLDVGIGNLQYPQLANLSKLHCGIDISDAALKAAKIVSNKPELLHCDARLPPIRSDSFDTVICLDVLSQSGTSAHEIIRQIHRITSDVAVMTVSHSDLADASGAKIEKLEFGRLLRTHSEFAIFDEEEISGFLSSIGFRIENMEIHLPYVITAIKDKRIIKAPADGFVAPEDVAEKLSSGFELKVLEWPLLKTIFIEARKEG